MVFSYPKGKRMYCLLVTDLIAIELLLVVCIALVTLVALANRKLTHSRDYWRTQYHELKTHTDLLNDPSIWKD